MAKRNQNIRFIRKRGRIIPIRIKKKDLSGEAKLAAGIGIGIGAVSLTKKRIIRLASKEKQLARLARKTKFRIQNLIKFGIKSGSPIKLSGFTKIPRAAVKLTRSIRFTLGAFGAATIAGSFLAQSGAEKIASKFKSREGTKDLLGSTTGAIFSFATTAFLLRRIKNPRTRRILLRSIGGRK